MQWYSLAFLSPLLWAISNHIDKYILSKYFKNINIGVFAIFSGIVGFLFSVCVLIFSTENILGISILNGIVIVLNGALLIIAYIPYYYAINNEDASSVAPLYQTIPVFSFAFGFLLFKEPISLLQILAGMIIIIGAVLMSVNFGSSKITLKGKTLFLMLLSSLLISVHYLIFKAIALQETFWRTAFWEYLGATAVSLFLFAFIKIYRRQFIVLLKENSISVILVNSINEIINIAAKLVANYATLLVPVFIVNLASGLQPMFVFIIGLIITIFFPFINKEEISKKLILQRVFAIFILLVGTCMLVY